MSNAKVFDPVPAQKRARAAEGPAASPLLAVRPFAEAKAKVENGEQRDLYGQYVQRRAVAAATEGGGVLGSGQNGAVSILSGPSLVAQRYVQDEPNAGNKISDGGALIYCAEQELYAGEAQFTQANAIGGQLQFNPGAPHATHGELRRVIPTHKENVPVAQGSAAYDREKGKEDLEGRAREDYAQKTERDALLDSVAQNLEDEWDSIPALDRKAEFGDEEFDYDQVRSIAGKWLDLLLAIVPIPAFDESRIAINFQAYLQKQITNGASILMPSDCGQAANVILGRNPEDALKGIQPGGVHIYSPQLKNRAKWEWDHHFAAIIMQDGNDHVTMENAGGKASDVAGKLTFDKTWFFEMYGTQEDQTFNEKYAKDFGD